MAWYLDRHVYYLHSEVYVSFLTLLHLCGMILTGYGVFYHSRDLNELQSNIWAICLLACTFFCNIFSTKCNPSIFRWFLPLTVLVSLTCFFTLSAYHGILMVYLVHLPVISFTLTGVPCTVLVAVCITSLILGAAFHMVLVSSLYAEYHGYHSMSSISETFSWLRPDAARGFTIVMLDTYIVIVQVLVGVLCYQRFVKLGHLMGAYRSNPAHYLGALDSVKRLEEDFLPPPQSSDTDVNADHNASDALRAVPSAVQSDDGDTVWENFERENLQSQARRTSVERIEPYRFQKTLQHATRIPATEGDAESNDSASVDLCLDEIRKHYKPRPGGYVESLLKIASFEEASREHSSRPSSRSTATFMDVVETSDSTLRHLSIAEQRQVAINEPYHPLTQRKRSSSQEASDREKRGTRLPEVPSKIALAPPSSKIAGSFMNDDANHRSRVFSKIDTLRQLSSSSYGAVTNEFVNMQLPSTTSKSWRDSYDEIRNMTRGLTSPHDNVAFTKFIEEENHRIRFQSFEGPEHVRQERHFREALPTGEGNICILSPNSFRTSRCTSQGTLNTADPNLSQPLTGNSAINTLISIIPSWCCRLLLSLIKAVNRQGHARDMMNHYIWSPSPRSPTTNSFGLFAHTRIESWYIEWMHDFNYKFYTFTFKETLSIFLLCVFSDLLVVVRMYSTLEDSVELEAFFSWVRIIIMMLRYIMYPLGIWSSLWHMTSRSGRDNFSHYRILLLMFIANIFLTFADLWLSLGTFTTGYALHQSLHICSLITTTSLVLFSRSPTSLSIYALCIIGYCILLYSGGYKAGYSILEVLTQLVVATGCMVFCVKPIDVNRRKLFCLFTLPYLFYLEAMHS